ncbi:hypothetical protein GJ697_17550 [Pseudoduganella sp. FT25W]|uniref:Flagellar hook-length control protein FliK n=1 Tax=Duganella alba TaxID=2666081 RepID=A0A6L5QIL8_9BURK|nr:hypothetical protein [Duganella alba]MRX09646.1 hypothetical protein [Duganella alba]MRX19671.1 hypothetical protein [Duganella alba]
MALERIGPLLRPQGVPNRQPVQPGQVTRAPDAAPVADTEFPLGPLAPGNAGSATGAAPIGAIPEAAEAHPLPPGGLEALADALADMPNAADPAAMRPNQVFLSRQLIWQPPDTAMMAASWQVMVRTYSEQRAAWLEQTTGQHLPASLFLSEQIPAGSRDGRPGLPMVTEMEPWRFAVYAWGDKRLVLKVVVIDDDEYDRLRRKRARAALRLELMLPAVGRVVIQLEPAGGYGVVMEVGAPQTAAMQHMREVLPQLAASVSRLGLTIVRCRLRRELPPPSSDHPYPSRMQTAALTAAIFHATAAVATLLSQPALPDDVQ